MGEGQRISWIKKEREKEFKREREREMLLCMDICVLLCVVYSSKNKCDKNYKFLPEAIFLRNGKLLSDVTLLLSTDRSTDGNGVGVSECERSCTARPPLPPLLFAGNSCVEYETEPKLIYKEKST